MHSISTNVNRDIRAGLRLSKVLIILLVTLKNALEESCTSKHNV